MLIPEWITLHQIQTVVAFILAFGLLLTNINWVISALTKHPSYRPRGPYTIY